MRTFIQKSVGWYFSKKSAPYWMVLTCDSILVVASGIIASALYKGPEETGIHFWSLIFTWIIGLIAYFVGFRIARTYTGVLRYSSFVDLARVCFANLIGCCIVFIVLHITSISTLKGIIYLTWPELIISFIIATATMWAVRIAVKYLYDICFVSASAQRVFIYGTKEGGVGLAKSVRSQNSQYIVSGFISDDPDDWQHMLMGVKIYPNNEHLVEKMRQKNSTIVMVSPLRTEALRDNQKMVDALTEAGIKLMVYNKSEWDGKSDLRHTQLKEVDIEDLLPRNQIEIDLDAVSKILAGKCIMITGAAGSIGSEIVRQVASFKPSQLVLIDQAETPLHDIRLMMARQFSDIPCLTLTASICHSTHMESIFKQYRPEYVFHAAAYKHVPMMEDNPGEAVLNNVRGTRVIADLAVKYGAKKFVMVSTDKAVNPTNVMGCSKRICEMYCQALNAKLELEGNSHTQFVTTRFGNVLGSNGSVIPLFKEQIKAGGPLTVTHPDIIRYFMLIPEACKLVLQAGTMGNGGEIFVFDMGKPVKIADLAKRMILLSGAHHVEIKYTGLRDGEKLYEELLNKEENTKPSSHPKIKLADVCEVDYTEVTNQIEDLISITKNGYVDMDIVRQMKVIVPEFKSKNSKYEELDK